MLKFPRSVLSRSSQPVRSLSVDGKRWVLPHLHRISISRYYSTEDTICQGFFEKNSSEETEKRKIADLPLFVYHDAAVRIR